MSVVFLFCFSAYLFVEQLRLRREFRHKMERARISAVEAQLRAQSL